MTTALTTYDPRKLTHEVFRLLHDQGYSLDRAGDFEAAVQGAAAILRYLGLEPREDPQLQPYVGSANDGHLGYERRVHGD